jgi:NAD(P)H-dependent FMN reductase
MSKKIKLIIGSTRQNRKGKAIADWLVDQANDEGVQIEVLDLKEINLPNFDAPIPPSFAPTQTDEGKTWQKQVGEADAFIFLTAEYNRSIPSSLKNAIDYLVDEWSNKPSLIVSYGYIDGGLSATKHLKDILGWVKSDVLDESITIKFDRDTFAEDGSFADIDSTLSDTKIPFIQSLKLLSGELAVLRN